MKLVREFDEERIRMGPIWSNELSQTSGPFLTLHNITGRLRGRREGNEDGGKERRKNERKKEGRSP